MVVLLPMLMAYSLIGEAFHEIIGTAMFVLMVFHHFLNRGWCRALFRQNLSVQWIIRIVLDVILFITMIAVLISGILMSKHIFTFIRIDGVSSVAREIHLFLAYWSFILMCFHAGTHLLSPVNKLFKRNTTACTALILILTGFSVYGIIAFANRQLLDYMLRKSTFVFFDYSEPRVFFFLDYMSIMILFAFIGCITMLGITAIDNRKTVRENEQQ